MSYLESGPARGQSRFLVEDPLCNDPAALARMLSRAEKSSGGPYVPKDGPPTARCVLFCEDWRVVIRAGI